MRKQNSSCMASTPSVHMFVNHANSSQGNHSFDHKSENPLHRRSTDRTKTLTVERLEAAGEVRFSQQPDESYSVFGRGLTMSGAGVRNKTEIKAIETSPNHILSDYKGG